jgi:NADH dehydrogenase
MKTQKICVLGGTGFVGSHVVARLAKGGHKIKVLTRHRERHKRLLVIPQVDLVEADVRVPQVLQTQFSGHDVVINLVGILNGSEQEFHAIHAELPRQVVETCRQTGVGRLLHMSALNADATRGTSLYLRSKGEGEQTVLNNTRDLRLTIFRPSVIFGPDDSFFNRFASLLRLSPLIPLACPNARFAPVYIDDVAKAFEIALENQATFGKALELCGPRTYTLREIVQYTAHLIGCKRLIIGLPDNLSRLQAKLFEYLPGKPFTLDNYRSMQLDNVCSSDGLELLGITPHSIEAIMPLHFSGKTQRARYNFFRRLARRD